MPPEVSVVIVSYNARELLGRCIESVRRSVGFLPGALEIIVVDNDSADGSADLVRSESPDVVVVESGSNGGMAFGNNVGMRAATGRLLLLLNSDAFLEPDALSRMVDALDVRDDVGLVGPRLVNEDGSLQRSVRGFPTPWRLATEFLYLRKLAPRSRSLNSFYGWPFRHDEDAEVDWVMGAVMLVRRSVIEQVGMMEESYFMYGEEVDWQRRMAAAGWKRLFVHGAQVTHLGGGSSAASWGSLYPVQVLNHVRYIARNLGEPEAARARRMILFSLGVRVAMYRLAAVLPGNRGRRRDRAAAFARARTKLRGSDVSDLARSRPAVERTPS